MSQMMNDISYLILRNAGGTTAALAPLRNLWALTRQEWEVFSSTFLKDWFAKCRSNFLHNISVLQFPVKRFNILHNIFYFNTIILRELMFFY